MDNRGSLGQGAVNVGGWFVLVLLGASLRAEESVVGLVPGDRYVVQLQHLLSWSEEEVRASADDAPPPTVPPADVPRPPSPPAPSPGSRTAPPTPVRSREARNLPPVPSAGKVAEKLISIPWEGDRPRRGSYAPLQVHMKLEVIVRPQGRLSLRPLVSKVYSLDICGRERNLRPGERGSRAQALALIMADTRAWEGANENNLRLETELLEQRLAGECIALFHGRELAVTVSAWDQAPDVESLRAMLPCYLPEGVPLPARETLLDFWYGVAQRVAARVPAGRVSAEPLECHGIPMVPGGNRRPGASPQSLYQGTKTFPDTDATTKELFWADVATGLSVESQSLWLREQLRSTAYRRDTVTWETKLLSFKPSPARPKPRRK